MKSCSFALYGLALASAFLTLPARAAQEPTGKVAFFTTNQYGPFELPADTYALAYAYDDSDPYALYARLLGCGQKLANPDLEPARLQAYFKEKCVILAGVSDGRADLGTRLLVFGFDHSTDVGSSTRSERLAGALVVDFDAYDVLRMNAIAEVNDGTATTGLPDLKLDFNRITTIEGVKLPALPPVEIAGKPSR